jgi:hypothetical protein
MFLNEKGHVLALLSDENCLWDLTLLCDISHHVLNTKLQGQPISDMLGAVRAFVKKLKLFLKQLGNINVCHFSLLS